MNVLLPLDNYEPSFGEPQTFFWRTTNLLQIYIFVLAVTLVGLFLPAFCRSAAPPPWEASLIKLNPPTCWNNDWSARLLSLHYAEEPLERLPEREVPVACRQSGGKQVADERPKPSSPLAKLSRIDSIAAAHV